jgi:hypothetical protein
MVTTKVNNFSVAFAPLHCHANLVTAIAKDLDTIVAEVALTLGEINALPVSRLPIAVVLK